MRLPPRRSWGLSSRGGTPLHRGTAGQPGWRGPPGKRAVCPAQRTLADSAEASCWLLPTLSHPGKERAREGGSSLQSGAAMLQRAAVVGDKGGQGGSSVP